MRNPKPGSPRESALSIICGEHAAFADALSWIRGQVSVMREHRLPAKPAVFEQRLAFIATFMERFHHPKEDDYLFKAIRERTVEAGEVLAVLQQQHVAMPRKFQDLRLALQGTRQGAASQLDDFADLMERFADDQTEHMRLETGLFEVAERVLEPADWGVIDVAFRAGRDPLFGGVGGGAGDLVLARR